ncbi:hypothetical protein Pla123a_18100 [Posidoniimonas polymericola]|uniref:Uncharacterized protein n=1 Tax=Posidoniimonas polymericola TaxID=2528002 RepID=A0A5C5YTA5_9BACT|nr:hypothetical protein [Posidoniimonas polymericola]TWT78010.1 hypothetical protein Pla123a_18100 [Posidoniimonas polymericola]
MITPTPNPYVSPESTAEPQAPAELLGARPASVKLAISGVALFTLLAFCICVQFWREGAQLWEIAVLSGVPALAGARIANGLFKRNRYARLWGRVLSFAGAVLMTLWVVAFGYAMWRRGAFLNTTPQPFMFGASIPENLRLVLMALPLGIQAASLWIAYFALGRRAAVRHFEPAARWGEEEPASRIERSPIS